MSGPWRHPGTALAGVVVAGLLSMRLGAVFLELDPARATDAPLLGPSWVHPLGTDPNGRDIALRVVEGVEPFFVPGLLAASVAVGLGLVAAGLLAWRPAAPWERVRGPLAALVQGMLIVLGAWPRLVLVVVAVAVFSASAPDPAAWADLRLFALGALVGLSFVPAVAARLLQRIQHLQRSHFVEAARAHGVPERWVLLRHVLWANCRHLLARDAASVFGAFLLVETSLSYLGDYGVPPPRPSWGNVLADLRFAVGRSRSLVEESGLGGLGRAVQEGSLLGVLVPALLIVVASAGLLALADLFARLDEA